MEKKFKKIKDEILEQKKEYDKKLKEWNTRKTETLKKIEDIENKIIIAKDNEDIEKIKTLNLELIGENSTLEFINEKLEDVETNKIISNDKYLKNYNELKSIEKEKINSIKNKLVSIAEQVQEIENDKQKFIEDINQLYDINQRVLSKIKNNEWDNTLPGILHIKDKVSDDIYFNITKMIDNMMEK